MIELSREQIRSYRLGANHLIGDRLSHRRLATACASGLQDSAPRSAVLSLAARAADVQPDDWKAPGLTQVFGPRGAIYVVPETDVPVFTLGLLPRNADRLARLQEVAEQAHQVLAGEPMRQRDLDAALPDVANNRELRWAACLGTLAPVWDAVDTIIHPIAKPEMDIEAARHELARRFFRYLGPATAADLQWWTAGDRRDTAETMAGLAGELTRVSALGEDLFALTETIPELINPYPTDADLVLLLPPDDPYIYRRARRFVLEDPQQHRLLWPQAPPPGALIVAGLVAGTWRRRGGEVAIETWQRLPGSVREGAERIAKGWPLGEVAIRVSWRSA